MNIVILDSYTANPGDLSWERLDELGSLTIYERTAPEQVVERAKDAEIVLTNKVVLTKEIILSLPKLRYIGVLATGYNVVDITAATEACIVVTNIPAYSTMSVAQMVIAHLLNVTNAVSLHTESVRKGEWQNSIDFAYWHTPQIELAGKTFGIIGLGNTGKATANIAKSLGMDVLAFTSKSQEQLPAGIRKAKSLDALLAESDVVSLHCPLSDNTKHLINYESIAKMKPTAILINTARGPVVDDYGVARALHEGKLSAYCADVLTEEPPRNPNPVISAPRSFITPHIAWATREARERLISIATANVKAFLDGQRINVVNNLR